MGRIRIDFQLISASLQLPGPWIFLAAVLHQVFLSELHNIENSLSSYSLNSSKVRWYMSSTIHHSQEGH